MKKFNEHKSIRKTNENIIASLCQFCALPESDKLYLSRLIRTEYLIGRLLQLDEHYDEMITLRDNMLKAGQKLGDVSVIKFSASLNSAIDAISNYQQDRDDLIICLRGALYKIKNQINEFNDYHQSDSNKIPPP